MLRANRSDIDIFCAGAAWPDCAAPGVVGPPGAGLFSGSEVSPEVGPVDPDPVCAAPPVAGDGLAVGVPGEPILPGPGGTDIPEVVEEPEEPVVEEPAEADCGWSAY